MKAQISLATLVLLCPLAWSGLYLLWLASDQFREPVCLPAAWLAELVTETGTVTKPLR